MGQDRFALVRARNPDASSRKNAAEQSRCRVSRMGELSTQAADLWESRASFSGVSVRRTSLLLITRERAGASFARLQEAA